jgi:hypothetical protein
MDTDMIKHAPISDTEKVIEHYTEKDGVAITYVCTTDLKNSDVPVDVFYRGEPHPEFGNRYFGLLKHPLTGATMICNADMVEDLTFGMIQDKNGDYWYSQCHHDYLVIDGNMIDGGREYVRSNAEVHFFKVRNGEMIHG